jgi:hypothetical protein
MRLLIITGVLLAAFGVFIVLKGLQLHSTGLVSVGPFHSTVHEQHTVPAMFGWVGIVVGVLLTVAGGFGEKGKR